MDFQNYLDSHPLRRAFIANLFDRAANFVSTQGELLLQDEDLSFPSRASSAVLYVGEHESASAADIASALELPHQLATQRVQLLLDLGLLERVADTQDGRRKILKLTAKGVSEYHRLTKVLDEASQALAMLFDEIECDLLSKVERLIAALRDRSLMERVQSIRTP